MRPLWHLHHPMGCLLMRHGWSTYTVLPIPTAENPIETLNDDLTTTTTHTSVRAYLAHTRRRCPHMLFKSVRGFTIVEIKWRLNDDYIRTEGNQ